MRVLVLGGTGTISQYIVEELAREGHEILLLNHHELQDLPSGVKTVICDRGNYPEFIRTCQSLKPLDCVYDMLTFTAADARSSVEAFAGAAKRVIFCSTVDVYDKNGKRYPVTEETPLHQRAEFEYAYNKGECEKIYREAYESGKFELVICRPAHTYSEHSKNSHLLFHAFGGDCGASYHLDRLRKGRPIVMQGDGLSIWTITHGKDVAHAFCMAMKNPNACGRSYTICGDDAMTYKEYWSSVAAEMHAPEVKFVCISSELLHRLEPGRFHWCYENFRYNNMFDNTAAKRDLDFRQTISWKEGIRRCLDVYEAQGFEDCDKPEYQFYDDLIRCYEQACDRLVSAYTDPGRNS